MCVCVGLCELWMADGIISSITEVSRRLSFVYFGMKTTQRVVPT